MDLSQRSNEKEFMDEGIISPSVWTLFIKDLAWINRHLMNIRSFTKNIKLLCHDQCTTVAEFACGGGDTLYAIAQWAKRQSLSLRLLGYDINADFIDHAHKRKGDFSIEFIRQDILSNDFSKNTFDIIICNLFCHHLTNEELVAFLKQVDQQARQGVIINDLHRHWLALIIRAKPFNEISVNHNGNALCN
jgi:2-polyprenyl-3-methyl-5-hydroxy-6-metoxy-1,4-benzoquinol methylase